MCRAAWTEPPARRQMMQMPVRHPSRQAWSARIPLAVICALTVSLVLAGNPERVAEPGAQDIARLDRGRMLIQGYLANDDARSKYRTAPGKLGTLRAIMKIEAIRPGRKDLLEALGIVLGDTFVQDMGFHWVVLDDGAGSRLAIRYRRRNIFLHPLTMIAERVQRGEQVDALDLYNEAAADAEELIDADAQ